MRVPYSIRRPLWLVPWLAYLGLTSITLGLHLLLDPGTSLIKVDFTPISDPLTAARFAAPARVWAASCVAAAAISMLVIAIGAGSAWELSLSAGPDRGRQRGAAAVMLSALTLVFWLSLGLDQSLLRPPPYWLPEAGARAVFTLPLAWVSSAVNALVATAVAALFAAVTVIIERARTAAESRHPMALLDRLRDRLSLLLGAGALGTAAAVFQLAALHRLPAAALLASGDPAQVPLAEALGRVARQEATFWGVSYSIGLGVLYLIPAWVLAVELARVDAPERETEDVTDESWHLVLKPLLRLVAALSPLLAGPLSDLLMNAAKS